MYHIVGRRSFDADQTSSRHSANTFLLIFFSTFLLVEQLPLSISFFFFLLKWRICVNDWRCLRILEGYKNAVKKKRKKLFSTFLRCRIIATSALPFFFIQRSAQTGIARVWKWKLCTTPESLTTLAATMVPEVQQQSRRLHVVHRRRRGPRPDEVQEPPEILVHSGRKDPPSATRVPGTQLRPMCLLLPHLWSLHFGLVMP